MSVWKEGKHIVPVFGFGRRPQSYQTINGLTVWQALNYQDNAGTGSGFDEFCEMPWQCVDVMRNQYLSLICSSGENLWIGYSLKMSFIRGFEINHRFTTLDT